MAPRKSVRMLEELCWKTTIGHFKTLRHQAKFLPIHLIDELYKRLCENDDCNNLPSKLFLHQKTTDLLTLPIDLRSKTKIISKFSRECKNLQRIVLHEFHLLMKPKSLTYITANNSSLLHLDITGTTDFIDLYLFVISKHCPQLQHLDLENVETVTDICMYFLPTTLTYLNVNSTDITANGCVVALNRLKSLKELEYRYWIELFLLLTLQQHKTSTFSIEYLTVYNEFNRDINLGSILVDMFPKLCDIRLVESISKSVINSLKECEKLNLITHLNLSFAVEDIIVISKFCPMLETLCARISDVNDRIEIYDTAQHVPFKYLRIFRLNVRGFNFPLYEFKLLLANFKWLESLYISDWHQLTDEMICNVLEENLLQQLENLSFYRCGPFTGKALTELISSLDCLKVMDIRSCDNFSNGQYSILKYLIHDNNLDVKLFKH